MLADRAESVAAYLLPAGKQIGPEWQAGDVSGAPGQSLSVHLTGDKAGVWMDFATDERGDLLALWQAVRGCDFPTALCEASEWLGLAPAVPVQSVQRQPARPVRVFNEPPAGVDGVSRFTYTDADKHPVIYVTREDRGGGKNIRQWGRSADGKGWQRNLDHAPKPRPLYRLPSILTAELVCIHEGEKAAVAATKAKLPGTHTTTIGGAGNARNSDFMPLQGKAVVIVPDNDEPGERHAEQVAKLAAEAGAKSVRTLHLPDLPEKGDVVEWLEAGSDAKAWADLIEQAPFFNSESCEKCEECEKTANTIPLDRVEHPATMDMRLMPKPLADVVCHVAEAMQAPVEMAWGVAMAVLATAIGKRAKIKLPTHVEPSPIWTCSILPPGSRKSGVFNALVSPLDEIEAEMQERWHEEWLQWNAEKELAEANIAEIKKQLRKKTGDRRALALELKEEMQIVEAEPVKPRLYLTDTTTEALRKALAAHGSIGLLSAEGSSVVETFGRYSGSKGADMALFLSAHAGDPDKGARVSGTHGIREALASMGITAQPDVLQAIGRDRMAKGRGLVDRLLFLMPPDPRGTRDYHSQVALDDVVMQKWSGMVRTVFDTEAGESPVLVEVSGEASEAWIEFAQGIEDRQKPGADLRGMSGFASKLAGAVGRIALAYNFAKGQDIEAKVDVATMLSAIGVGHVLIEHAKAAMQMMGEDETTVRARMVAEGIARHRLETVKPWEIASKHLGGCKTADEARETCHKLAEHGYLIPDSMPASDTGRRPKESYNVHADLFSHFSHFSQDVETEKQGLEQ